MGRQHVPLKMELMENGCVECTSHKYNKDSALRYRIPTGPDKGEILLLHRHLWMQQHGEVPKGSVLKHICGNKKCLNIDHIAAVPKRLKGTVTTEMLYKTWLRYGMMTLKEFSTLLGYHPNTLRKEVAEWHRLHGVSPRVPAISKANLKASLKLEFGKKSTTIAGPKGGTQNVDS